MHIRGKDFVRKTMGMKLRVETIAHHQQMKAICNPNLRIKKTVVVKKEELGIKEETNAVVEDDNHDEISNAKEENDTGESLILTSDDDVKKMEEIVDEVSQDSDRVLL